jgi:hypothetical protein
VVASRARVCAAAPVTASVLYTFDDLQLAFAPAPKEDPANGAEGESRERAATRVHAVEVPDVLSTPESVDVPVEFVADRLPGIALEEGTRVTSAPWVPFSPSGSACFEVVLDVRQGLSSTGVTFQPGPDGRPRVASVSESGSAFGEVAVGDVLLETSAVEIMGDSSGTSERGVPRRMWRDSKDSSFHECMAEMRTNVFFAASSSRNEPGADEPVLSMRLCRDYVGNNAIPMRDGGDAAASVEWVDHDGSAEWNEEAMKSGKEWAAKHARGC